MPAFAHDFNPNTHVTRRVRLDLPLTLLSPYKEMLEKLPYAVWLKTHAAEVRALTDDKGEKLLFSIHPRMAQGKNSSIFVTDFEFTSPSALKYYNQYFLPTMRGRIEESYFGAMASDSPFAYRIALDTDAEKFAALVDDVTEFQTIV
jgi:hypothetical protein